MQRPRGTMSRILEMVFCMSRARPLWVSLWVSLAGSRWPGTPGYNVIQLDGRTKYPLYSLWRCGWCPTYKSYFTSLFVGISSGVQTPCSFRPLKQVRSIKDASKGIFFNFFFNFFFFFFFFFKKFFFFFFLVFFFFFFGYSGLFWGWMFLYLL